jgi:hypothetical protein
MQSRGNGETIIAANGAGKNEIQAFPPERKRIDIDDFLTDDRQFRTLPVGPPISLADGLQQLGWRNCHR